MIRECSCGKEPQLISEKGNVLFFRVECECGETGLNNCEVAEAIRLWNIGFRLTGDSTFDLKRY
jgi:hypothetical protein